MTLNCINGVRDTDPYLVKNLGDRAADEKTFFIRSVISPGVKNKNSTTLRFNKERLIWTHLSLRYTISDNVYLRNMNLVSD